ncbi:centromere protein V-like [Argiope bruennichi]|uniref:centromere protein V-like n=1 Tax=Argiope bruennichi TaxID=94029 RepID=UPI0024942954|nr:centromere protein V-like [Argiope bruennichi]XP_055927743.1 centromere protein V-like [Argiope bruennichi]
MEDNSLIRHIGGCHCGAVRFAALAPPKVRVCECNCSVCVKKQIKGFLVPAERFEILQGKDNLTEYTFNTGIAKHWFCKTCGVQSFYRPRSNPEGISVSIYCLDPGTVKEVEKFTFDGQNWEEEMKKRGAL